MSEFANAARLAYVSGWAATNGPFTDQVRAGCAAAVALACEHDTEPGVLEATVRLGELEGIWAEVYARRDALVDERTRLAAAAWTSLTVTADVAGSVATFRRRLALASEATDPETRDRHRAEAAAAALLLLSGIVRDRHDPKFVALATLVTDALRAAWAEGYAGALALAAHQAGHGPVDVAAVFADAYTDHPGDPALAAAVITALIRAAAGDVAAVLARLADDGADYDEMVRSVWDLLDDDELRALTVGMDVAMGAEFAHAGLSLYREHGARYVDFVTVGGALVCGHCMDAESASPHPIGGAPTPPLHPYCRCVLIPTSPLTLDVFPYLLGGSR
ncbi:hypothetical protein DMC64_41650 [Amycolatopsis sp. WAC 04197]|uniref:hypothetical protein n=1 Tax=Amycolatopsis sp. WAC 04197 TaxID=2203199 RepID=UPI000F79E951|nr:hypothetical protein [Amycolatopsis sp. WAC 04197]RSN38575.1 hypothetical protein DMC64_41650 [Amycolatopsis sp. WAC 04197]